MLLMASPFETIILRLKDLGAFEFLFPFMLTAAIFYGLLRKSKLFGEPERNVVVNATIALVAAFMVWSYPILTGVSIQQQLATFMFQSLVALLVVMVGLMAAAFFGEKIGLSEKQMSVTILIMVALVGGAVLFSSGLVSVFFPAGVSAPEIDKDTLIGLAMVAAIVVAIFFITRGK